MNKDLIFRRNPIWTEIVLVIISINAFTLTLSLGLANPKSYWQPVLWIISTLILFVFLSKNIRIIFFLEDHICIKYQLLNSQKVIPYNKIKNITYRHVYNSGPRMIVRYDSENGSIGKISFSYHSKGNNLLKFLNEKGFNI